LFVFRCVADSNTDQQQQQQYDDVNYYFYCHQYPHHNYNTQKVQNDTLQGPSENIYENVHHDQLYRYYDVNYSAYSYHYHNIR